MTAGVVGHRGAAAAAGEALTAGLRDRAFRRFLAQGGAFFDAHPVDALTAALAADAAAVLAVPVDALASAAGLGAAAAGGLAVAFSGCPRVAGVVMATPERRQGSAAWSPSTQHRGRCLHRLHHLKKKKLN
eukprot:TRINITY_DN17061_c0_g1_i1.p3 TRINITY_DN17061_c0_g1~~TRINITY_DN17061_c0_g1_i1.p3  ORF type:complete len:131 (-),score=41.92 TRINITY_DN17061_c0_g1_i1:33-425(-)